MRIVRKDKKKKGFTLIELVAVVAIIGILAAILVPKIAGYMNEAKKTKVIDQARKVLLVVETYNMKHDTPIAMNDTVPGVMGLIANNSATQISTVTAKDSVRTFIDPNAADSAALYTAGGALDKLPQAMTLGDCVKIVEERKDFTLTSPAGGNKDSFGAVITESTTPAPSTT